VDKLERATYDALTQALAWEDDGRVLENHSVKAYPGEHSHALDKPGVVIRLYTLAKPAPEQDGDPQ
jgi:Holliday junction resolvase RusA-like endonuclease